MNIKQRIKRLLKGQSNLDRLLNTSIYKFVPTGEVLTIAHAVSGLYISGGVGTGKTSGPGTHINLAYLKAGMGGLFLTVKTDEAQRLIKLVKNAGRMKDLILLNRDSSLSFSFIEYELNREGNGAAEIDNLVDLLMQVYHMGKDFKVGSQSESKDKFWDDALERTIKVVVRLLQLAKMPVTFKNMRRVIITAFKEKEAQHYHDIWAIMNNTEMPENEIEEVFDEYAEWINKNFLLRCIHNANTRKNFTALEQEILEDTLHFWLSHWPSLSDKTTVVIIEMFHALIDPFTTGILRSHFSEGISEELLPENTYKKGTIIIIDIPVKEYGIAAIYAQGLYKLIWQKAMERRIVETEEDPKAVTLWIDEAQNLISPSYDTQFTLTARSCLVATVFISQTINAITFAMGNLSPKEKAKALLANLTLKIFCNNSCVDTNNWASEILGKHEVDEVSFSTEGGNKGRHTYNQRSRHYVPADHFTTLKTGGRENKYKVEAIVFRPGKKWSNGYNFLEGMFKQNI